MSTRIFCFNNKIPESFIITMMVHTQLNTTSKKNSLRLNEKSLHFKGSKNGLPLSHSEGHTIENAHFQFSDFFFAIYMYKMKQIWIVDMSSDS